MIKTARELAEALNTYTGENFWQDVVEDAEYDRTATEAEDPGYTSAIVVLCDGTRSTYRERAQRWIASD